MIGRATEGREDYFKQGHQMGENLYMVKHAQPYKMEKNVRMLVG